MKKQKTHSIALYKIDYLHPMKKIMLLLFILIALLAIAYLLGPKAHLPSFNAEIPILSIPLNQLDEHVAKQEALINDIRPNNHARIVWANDTIKKTAYSIVYLHGFSAGPLESNPVIFDIAKNFGYNLYLPRLADHGRSSEESFKDLTGDQLILSAKKAMAIGKLIGEKVIVISCSTGSTLSSYLAAENPESTFAMIMYSPNFALHDGRTQLMAMPWGLQLARKIFGSSYRSIKMEEGAKPYWTTKYRVEGLVNLIPFLNKTMTDETFEKVKQPYCLVYYYENDENCDKIISVPRIRDFHRLTATPNHLKKEIPLASVKSHCISNKHQSKDWQSVYKATEDFFIEVLKLTPE